MKNMYVQLFKLLEKRKSLVLATIIDTKGSTPQVSGATALFSSKGLLEGTLGGGVLEADGQRKALLSLKRKESLVFKFSLKADMSSEEEAICGGEVKILIEPSPEKNTEAFRSLCQSLARRKPGVLATFINRISDKKASVLRFWIGEKSDTVLEKHSTFFRDEVEKTLSGGKPRLLEIKEKVFADKGEESLLFLEPVFPFPHLIIAGAGHVGQAVAHLGNLLNFEVTVIDDRPEFANRKKLPDADAIIVGDFEKVFKNFPITPDTYLVIVTRGHHYDGTVLRHCIASEAAYIGLIGSQRKIKLMREKFLEEGWATPAQFDRVYAPIGIPIQSKTVEEIAVSIGAQLVLVRSQIQERGERSQ